jgi:hypothetical protein
MHSRGCAPPRLVGLYGSFFIMGAHGASSLEGGQPGRGGLAGRPARALGQQGLHHGLVERAPFSQRGFARNIWDSGGCSMVGESKLSYQHSVLEHMFWQ